MSLKIPKFSWEDDEGIDWKEEKIISTDKKNPSLLQESSGGKYLYIVRTIKKKKILMID